MDSSQLHGSHLLRLLDSPSWTLCLVFGLLLMLFATPAPCSGSPIPAPNISYCRLQSDEPYDCCAPASHLPPRPFKFDPSPTMKIRRPAHKVDDETAQKLAKAYLLMKELPMEDPRGFGHQANIHCAYCSEFYIQGNTTAPLQIHASWLFFPFHRWYNYFHERILAKLIGDDTLAVPFWNYDHPQGSSIPDIYLDYYGLIDTYKEPSHMPPAVAAIDTVSLRKADRSRDDQLRVNRAAMYWLMVTGASTPIRFFGQPYRFGDKQMPGYGTVETMPHNGLHVWTGDSTIGYKHMGNFATAGRDPLFYAHHSELDRLWEVWKNISEDNVEIGDPDFLDSEFVFYDENAELVRVSVRDSLNITKLGYMYEEVENLWLNNTPKARSSGVASLGEDAVVCQTSEALVQPCSVYVARDKQAASNSVEAAETLVIHGIELENNSSPLQFNVFVNLPVADASTLIDCTEFAGAFSALIAKSPINTSLRLGIGFIVRLLNLAAEDRLVVTIVPTSDAATAVKFSSVSIEYEDVVVSSYVI